MEILKSSVAIILVVIVSCVIQVKAEASVVYCSNPFSRCFDKEIECPFECPNTESDDPKAKVCYVNCDHPTCKPQCKRKMKLLSSFFFRNKLSEKVKYLYCIFNFLQTG